MLLMHRMSAVGALALLAACSSTEPDGTANSNLTMDVAMVATEMGGQDVEVMHGPGGVFGFGLNTDPSRFRCESAEHEGVTIVRTCTYADADGIAQTGYDSNTTESVTMHSEITGAIEREHWSATIDRTTDLVVSGLAGANTTMIWNGTGSGSSSRVRESDSGETREYDMTFSGSIANVVIPVPRTPTSWPLSGTISRDVTVTFIGGPHDGTTRQVSTTLEFNGTQYATLTVNGETFTVDLARRSCHRGSRDHGEDHDRDHDDDQGEAHE